MAITPGGPLVANQTVTLAGRGFSTGGSAFINTWDPDGAGPAIDSLVTINGDSTDLGSLTYKLNEGEVISVDNAGNWSSSFIIPVTITTITPGDHELSITDTEGGRGSAVFNIAKRTLTLSPASSRVGSKVNIEGSGFPAYNPDTGGEDTAVVSIGYSIAGLAPRTIAALIPDRLGRIRGSFVVPLDAGAPSTNAVLAAFDVNGFNVVTGTVHAVAIPSLPGAPHISGPIIAGANSLTVAWAAPASGPAVTAYDLRYIRTDADETVEANWTVVEDVWTNGFSPLEYVLTGLEAATQYDIQMRAVNVSGNGPWSTATTRTPSTWGATRSFSKPYVDPGGEVVVTVTAAGYGAFGHIVETLPAGFSYVSSSLPNHAIGVNGQEVSFTLLDGQAFTYTASASNREGSYAFYGIVMNADELEQPVGGISFITVQTAPSVYASMNTETPVRFNAAIPVTATFSEPVFSFTIEDVVTANGTVGNFTGSDGGAVYTFDVTPNAEPPRP